MQKRPNQYTDVELREIGRKVVERRYCAIEAASQGAPLQLRIVTTTPGTGPARAQHVSIVADSYCPDCGLILKQSANAEGNRHDRIRL